MNVWVKNAAVLLACLVACGVMAGCGQSAGSTSVISASSTVLSSTADSVEEQFGSVPEPAAKPASSKPAEKEPEAEEEPVSSLEQEPEQEISQGEASASKAPVEPDQAQPASSAPAESASQPAVQPADPQPAGVSGSPKEIALSMIGGDAADLVQAIGQPGSTEYASSCIGDGEDGIWYYDGFNVYTYRGTDGSERIEDVF